MTIRNVTKMLASMEDLLVGRGAQQQERGGSTITVHGIDVAFAVDSVAEMQALDVARFKRARVYSSVNNYMTYVYDATDNTGISSDTGSGTWVTVPESESVLVALSKADLRNEEPAYNYQVAMALGGSSLTTGAGASYYYDPNSTASDDGDDVLVTTGGARWLKWLGAATSGLGASYVVATGGTNNLEVALGVTAIPENQVVFIKASATCTGATTLKVDALSAVPLRRVDDTDTIAGNLEVGKVYTVVLQSGKAIVLDPSISQAQAIVGTDNQSVPTMLRVAQYVEQRVTAGSILDKARLYELLGTMNIEEGLEVFDGGRIEPGCCSAFEGDGFMVLDNALVRNLNDPWVEGGPGGRASGVTIADNTWYILFLIGKPDGTVDAGWDTDINATNLLATATGYTIYRPIGLHWYWSNTSTVECVTNFRRVFNMRDVGKWRQRYVIKSSITANMPPKPTQGFNLTYYKVDLMGGGGGGGGGAVGENGSGGGTTSCAAIGGTLTADGGQGGRSTSASVVGGGQGGTPDSYSSRNIVNMPGLAGQQGDATGIGAHSLMFGPEGEAQSYGAGGTTGSGSGSLDIGGGSGARNYSMIREGVGTGITLDFTIGAGGAGNGDGTDGIDGVAILEI